MRPFDTEHMQGSRVQARENQILATINGKRSIVRLSVNYLSTLYIKPEISIIQIKNKQ